MFVGNELRHYHFGIPMGEQGSCAKAAGVGLDAELACDADRERTHGDSERNLSLQYVDDAEIAVAYSDTGEMGWTRDSAIEYAESIGGCYPDPLYMEFEPLGVGTYRFLETDTHMPSESWCYSVHHNRPWAECNFNMAAPGGPLFYRQELNTAVGTCIRTTRNTTPRMRNAAVEVLCARLLEMINGVGPGFPVKFVRHHMLCRDLASTQSLWNSCGPMVLRFAT